MLQKVKDAFAHPQFQAARDVTNPFEKIGNSIFLNRAAVKLANIDALFSITGEQWHWGRRTSDKGFTFCDIAAGPGGFTEYLQYRYPQGRGWGMTLQGDLDWRRDRLDLSRFTPLYGPDGSGDLYRYWSWLLEQVPPVDLVTADGGFDTEDQPRRQEELSSQLLVVEGLLGIQLLRPGGTFVLKLFDTSTAVMADLIYLLATAFEEIVIVKPVSSRPANSERYLVARRRRDNVTATTAALTAALAAYSDTHYLDRLITEPLPSSFLTWLREGNRVAVAEQLAAARRILLLLKGADPQTPRYYLPRCLLLWSVPATPIREPRQNHRERGQH
jgi:cap1 methyltransferase